MNAQNEKKPIKVYGVIKYISGVLGFLGILLAIFTLTGVVDWYLVKVNYTGKFDDNAKLITSLLSSILGIFFIFIAFSKEIDKFFGFLETHSINKKDDTNGITIESIFFFTIAVILITLSVLLGTGYLALKTELPLIKSYTKNILIGALIILSLLAIVTAFNNIISQSVKEMKKVHWPTGKQMADYSKKVFSFIIFFSLFFLSLDLILTYLPRLVEHVFKINL